MRTWMDRKSLLTIRWLAKRVVVESDILTICIEDTASLVAKNGAAFACTVVIGGHVPDLYIAERN
jgi:hypothetical protein